MQQISKTDLLKKVFDLSEEEFLSHNQNSTLHIQNYFNNSIDERFIKLYTYLDNLKSDLSEYCEFGADKCKITNFKEFCDNLDIDITENLVRIIKEYYHIFENKHEIINTPTKFFTRISNPTIYHFYNRDKTFMFSCTSPLFMEGSLAYFGCTGLQKYVLKAFEMIYNDGNTDLCYGARDYA